LQTEPPQRSERSIRAMSRHPVNGQRRALDEPFDVMGE